MIYVRNSFIELHIRTESRGRWSAVTHVAVQMAGQTLEIAPDGYFLDGVTPTTVPTSLGGVYPLQASSSQWTIVLSGGQFLSISRNYNSLTIRMSVHGSDFVDTVGMSGTWTKFGLIGRDGNTTFTDTTAFAQDWEVRPLEDPTLFRVPSSFTCAEPGEGPVFTPEVLEVAETVCAFVTNDIQRQACIFDVVAADGDSDAVTSNEVYLDPLGPMERCATTGPDCRDSGGQCVWRCNRALNYCDEDLCMALNETMALVVVDGGRRRHLQESVTAGCACAIPFGPPSEAPSDASTMPSLSSSLFPSVFPTSSGTDGKSETKSEPPSAVPSKRPTLSPSQLPTSDGKGKGGNSKSKRDRERTDGSNIFARDGT